MNVLTTRSSSRETLRLVPSEPRPGLAFPSVITRGGLRTHASSYFLRIAFRFSTDCSRSLALSRLRIDLQRRASFSSCLIEYQELHDQVQRFLLIHLSSASCRASSKAASRSGFETSGERKGCQPASTLGSATWDQNDREHAAFGLLLWCVASHRGLHCQ